MATINNFIENYTSWLNENTNLKEIDDWVEISTPFLDNHNDHLQIYVKPLDNSKYLLTDDGYVINNLLLSGCDISTPKRNKILELIINRYGIRLEDDRLIVESNLKNYAQKKHMLIQAMMSVSDMFMLSRSTVVNIFLEEIELFFEEKDIPYLANFHLKGKTGFSHSFDFALPKRKEKPERLLKAINKPTRSKAESALFAWDDVKSTRNKDSKFIVLLNDNEEINDNVIHAFNEYGVDNIPWSKRNEYIEKIA